MDAHAQVVLQQAQQIIDASLMQQPTQQRPQHVCLSVIIVYCSYTSVFNMHIDSVHIDM